MSFVIPVALQIHFFSKNKNDAGYMQEPNRTLLKQIRTNNGVPAHLHCQPIRFESKARNSKSLI